MPLPTAINWVPGKWTWDIKQSSDLVQRSEEETALKWHKRSFRHFDSGANLKGREQKSLPSLTSHRWKSTWMRTATDSQSLSHRHIPGCAHLWQHNNNPHLAHTKVVVKWVRKSREGGISWGSSWLPAGPQNSRIIGVQRWMWQRPQMYTGWQNRGGII